jgi:predicted ATP-grasp superfamily ATP-dependent carboligase
LPPEEKDGKLEVYSISTTNRLRDKLDDYVEELKNGIIIGMSAALLLESKDEGVNASCIMSESRSSIPDGMAAAEIIKKFNKIYGFKIDTSELEKQAKDFEKKLEKVLRHARKFQGLTKEAPSQKIYG